MPGLIYNLLGKPALDPLTQGWKYGKCIYFTTITIAPVTRQYNTKIQKLALTQVIIAVILVPKTLPQVQLLS